MVKVRNISWVVCLFILQFNLFAQGLIINEVMSSNSSVYFDEFGDTPDWIEIFNSSGEIVNLSSFALSDDIQTLQKWIFPSIDLSPNDFILVNASGRDLNSNTASWETIIDKGASWSYIAGTQEPPATWKDIGFLTIGWNLGFSGIGYGDDDDLTVIDKQNSIYLRKNFEIGNVENITQILFNIDYDDGFVAYINGNEIARSNLGNSGEFIPYNRFADVPLEARLYRNQPLEEFFINDISSFLVNGTNVLSIQVHNANLTSSDLSAIPFLTLGYKLSGTNYIAEEVKFYVKNLHANFSISNGNESIYLTNNLGIIIDSVGAIELPNNTSYGRNQSDINIWSIFQIPTPAAINSSIGYSGQTELVTINLPGGFYQTSITLEISNQTANSKTYYTTDGSEPSIESYEFNNQLLVNKTTVVKYQSFSNGLLPSGTITNTYFINENTDLPTVSISTNPINLWDENSGIYVLGPNAESGFPYFNANFWQDWEKPASLEIYDTKRIIQFNNDVNIKIFGGWSRGNSQKSLSVFTKNGNSIKYKLIKNLEIEDFKSVVLRNSGNDWNSTMLRDGFIHSLADGLNIDHLGFEPAILYLNGEYWGIHNIREKLNLNYISSHYDVDKQNIDLLELDGNIIDGTNEEYQELKAFITNNNLSIDSKFDVVKNSLDINSFIDYNIFQIYIANTDWPGNNNKFWKERTDAGKWRWILFDTDFAFSWIYGADYSHNTLGFALETNGPGWPNPPWSTLFLRKFLENAKFKNDFINRYSDLANTEFLTEGVKDKLSQAADKIRAEIPKHINKWNQFSLSGWESNISLMRRFAVLRITFLDKYFKDEFGLSGISNINVSLSEANSGKVKISTIIPQQYPWSGNYFNGSKVKLVPKPDPGFLFTGWSGGISSSKDTLELDINSNLNIIANFQPIIDHPTVVINEINYHSNSTLDTEDWVELYNNSDKVVDISNWVFKDEVDTNVFVIPNLTNILPQDFVILCRDTASFRNFINDNIQTIGNFPFGLNNSGDLIRLYTEVGVLVDSVRYDDYDPWPLSADGLGNTLELVNPSLDNSFYVNWKSSLDFGSPGNVNTTFATDISESQEIIPDVYILSQNYPNPFNPTTTISYTISTSVKSETVPAGRQEAKVKLVVYDVLGRELKTLVNKIQTPGSYKVLFDASALPSGVYFYKLSVGEFITSKKMILLK